MRSIFRYRSIIPVILITLLTTVFIWYVSRDSLDYVEKRIPGMDGRPKMFGERDTVIVGKFFETYASISSFVSGSWPRFRGNEYNNICKDKTPTMDSWPNQGPDISWQIKLGEGHAAPSIHNGKVYVLDYDEKIQADALRCFSFKTGEEIWRRWYNVAIKRNHGMSRTIPTVTDKYIISIGPKCHVMCMNTESGDLLWALDLVRDYEAQIPQWYTAQCPVIDNDIAVIAVGGSVLMMGIDCKTGEVVWKTQNSDLWKMSHSSIIPATIHGRKTYIYMAIGGICGVAANGEDVGKILWKTSEWSPTVVATSPLYIGNNEIVFTTGYGSGGGKLRINKSGSEMTAEIVETHSPREGLASEQQTPILTDGYIWTINPKDAGALRNQLTCYHTSDLRNPVWNSGKENRYGLGPYLVVGDKMYLVNDNAELFMFRFSANSVTLMDRFTPLDDGTDAWGPLAFADGYLLMRDSHNLLCLDLRDETSKSTVE